MTKSFYITTPIYYINDVPHIGHSGTTIVADIVARFHRICGEEVFFLTGTDEHGTKIAQTAEKKGLPPDKFCDQVSKRFKEAWKKLNISNDFFIRTTDPRHKKIVSQLIENLYRKGDIYKSTYKGLYCIGCEKFLTDSDLINGICPLHPPESTVKQEEENWFFKLSKYTGQIIKLIENDKTNYIFPCGKRQEVLSKLKAGVHDVSISRANVKWGIPIPWDKTQTIYVWFDALINYYSAIKFLPGKEKFWPADIHLLGKEIFWFHTVMWQAMLLSAGIPLPKKTYIHSFYVIDDKKMSKSMGNMIKPKELIDKFGVDGTRYLIASSFPAENDTNISRERLKKKYNADLANGLGNLISRTASLVKKNNYLFEGKFSPSFMGNVEKNINSLAPAKALDEIWNNSKQGVSAINRLINEKKVWELRGEKFNENLNEITKLILNLAYNLKPFIPETAEKIEQIFTGKQKLTASLFPRLA